MDDAVRLSVRGGTTSREVAEQRVLDAMGGPNAKGVLNIRNPIGGRPQLRNNSELGSIHRIAVPDIGRTTAGLSGAGAGMLDDGYSYFGNLLSPGGSGNQTLLGVSPR